MEEKSTAKRVGAIIKTTLTVVLFVFIGALIFRMCQASHQALEETVITEEFKSAYKLDNDIRTHAVTEEFSENGAVYAYSLVYMKKAGYLQFTVRYNTRHIDEVKETYPEFDEKNIRYTLVDAKGKEYKPNVLESDEAYNYKYFKLEFTDVNFESDNLSVKMHLDGIDINMGTKSTAIVHKKDSTSIPYQLTGDDEDALLGK